MCWTSHKPSNCLFSGQTRQTKTSQTTRGTLLTNVNYFFLSRCLNGQCYPFFSSLLLLFSSQKREWNGYERSEYQGKRRGGTATAVPLRSTAALSLRWFRHLESNSSLEGSGLGPLAQKMVGVRIEVRSFESLESLLTWRRSSDPGSWGPQSSPSLCWPMGVISWVSSFPSKQSYTSFLAITWRQSRMRRCSVRS